MTEAYYFGCLDSPGHHLYSPGRNYSINTTPVGFPLNRFGLLDSGLLPCDDPQDEGQCSFCHLNGWTIISFWDRSVDKRHGCNSSFLIKGYYDFNQMIGYFKEFFPKVYTRFKFPLVLRQF